MISVSIDVAKCSHEACFMDAEGQEVGRPLRFPNTAGGVAALSGRLRRLDQPGNIALGATVERFRSGRFLIWFVLPMALARTVFGHLGVDLLILRCAGADTMPIWKTTFESERVMVDWLVVASGVIIAL